MKIFDPTKPIQTRDGRKARIIAIKPKETFSIIAVIDAGENSCAYTSDGQYLTNGKAGLDLVNIPEPAARRTLSFFTLRAANIARLPTFKNSKGELAHSEPDGSDWSPAQWLQALVGELGEYANKRKKFERGDISAEEFKIEAAKELADVQIYLDILAFRLGVDLGQATEDKFNEVSRRVGSSVFIRDGAIHG